MDFIEKLLKTTDDTAKTINSFFKPTGLSSKSLDNQQTENSNLRTNTLTIENTATDSSSSTSDHQLENLLNTFTNKIKLSDPEHTEH